MNGKYPAMHLVENTVAAAIGRVRKSDPVFDAIYKHAMDNSPWIERFPNAKRCELRIQIAELAFLGRTLSCHTEVAIEAAIWELWRGLRDAMFSLFQENEVLHVMTHGEESGKKPCVILDERGRFFTTEYDGIERVFFLCFNGKIYLK